eukprot:1887276-Prymnesium_polylepis.1
MPTSRGGGLSPSPHPPLLPVATAGKLDIMYKAKFRAAVYGDDKATNLDNACTEQLATCNNSAYLII